MGPRQQKTEELWEGHMYNRGMGPRQQKNRGVVGGHMYNSEQEDTGKVNELMSRDLMAILEYHMVLGAEE